MRFVPVALLGLALLAGACRKDGDPARERYLEARRAYGAIFARTLDESCPEEPACGAIVAALASIPDDHPDAPEARKVLARIERARAAAGEDEVPGFLRGDEPRLPEPDEVPAFLQERIGAGANHEVPAPGRGGAGGATAEGSDEGSVRPAAGAGEEAPEVGPGDGGDDPSSAADDSGATVIARDGGDVLPPPANADEAGAAAIGGDGGDDPSSAVDDSGSTVIELDGGDDPPSGTDGGSGAAVIVLDGDAAGAGESTSIFLDGDTAATPGEPPPPDPCEDLRRQLAKRKDWLARTAAERNTIAHVTDPADFAALLQHRTMARCAAHPDDPDCAPPPLEADVAALTVELDSVTRQPGELVADGRNPDDLPHDPVVRDLENRLRRCEAAE